MKKTVPYYVLGLAVAVAALAPAFGCGSKESAEAVPASDVKASEYQAKMQQQQGSQRPDPGRRGAGGMGGPGGPGGSTGAGGPGMGGGSTGAPAGTPPGPGGTSGR
jgi:hypothetical protein